MGINKAALDANAISTINKKPPSAGGIGKALVIGIGKVARGPVLYTGKPN